MKLFILLAILSIFILAASDCNQEKKGVTKYKGRLEIKGICFNYTIKLLEGAIDSSQISNYWVDESTGKSYANVFKLNNPCSFPATINAGDEFYFIIDSSAPKECIVCEAYYPTPFRSLQIKVLGK